MIVTSRIYGPEASAASLRLGALVTELRARGTEVRVLTTRLPRGCEDEMHEPGVSRWPVLRDRAGYVRGYLPYLSFDVPLAFRILFGRRADVYVCEPPPTTGFVVRLCTALKRRPYVYYGADIWSDASSATGAPRFVVRVVRWMERTAMRGAASVLVVTEGVQRRVAALAPGVTAPVVGHGVDFTHFSASADPIVDAADVVYVGSASEWHGAEIAVAALVEVMRVDPTVTAAFIGQGASWPGLQRDVAKSGLTGRIRFVDTVPPGEAARWLRGAKVSIATLAPGQGYDFAVPTKLYASVAVGTPVVYAGPDPVRTMINENHLGIGVAYDRESLVAALQTSLEAAASSDRAGLVGWARSHVSAAAVAGRSADVVLRIARAVTGRGHKRR